jgi:hypothetical protein
MYNFTRIHDLEGIERSFDRFHHSHAPWTVLCLEVLDLSISYAVLSTASPTNFERSTYHIVVDLMKLVHVFFWVAWQKWQNTMKITIPGMAKAGSHNSQLFNVLRGCLDEFSKLG